MTSDIVLSGDADADLQEHLDVVGRRLNGVCDSDGTEIGKRLREKFEATGCKKSTASGLSCIAVYEPFSFPPLEGEPSFTNTMRCGTPLRSLEKLFSSVCHEGLHALQWDGAAILHASFFNDVSPFVICPRDWAMLVERTEQDACVKEAWLCWLGRTQMPELEQATTTHPVSVSDFEALQALGLNIEETLRTAAVFAMEKIYGIDDFGNQMSFADYYHRQALESYNRMMLWRAGNCSARQIVVRMEEQDIRGLGNTIGPNIFEDLRFSKPPLLSAANEALVQKLNKALGIIDEGSLPTYSEALAQWNMSSEEFLSLSKTMRQGGAHESGSSAQTPSRVAAVTPPPAP